jgi:hypothetical protein
VELLFFLKNLSVLTKTVFHTISSLPDIPKLSGIANVRGMLFSSVVKAGHGQPPLIGSGFTVTPKFVLREVSE